MRIGMFSESYTPILNGVAISIETLIKELRELGHQVYIFAPEYPGHVDHDKNVIRFPSFRTWIEPDYPIPWPHLPGLTGKVKALNLDIIHTHIPWVLGWVGLRIAKRLGIPLISTNHTLYAEYTHYIPLAPRETSRAIIISMMRRYYNKCDGVVVPSEPTKRLLKEYGVHRPIFIIPTGNALDTTHDPNARTEIRREFRIPQDATVLLFVGRLAKEKNIEMLLQAFDRLAHSNSDICLMVVGGGPHEQECRKMASRLKAADKVIFTGCVPSAKYYSAGDLFVFPSSTETQGLVLSEALRAGLPCVAVNSGGSPYVLTTGEDGFLTEANLDDFTTKIDLLLKDKETMHRFAENAVRNSNKFSPKAMANSMIEVYDSALSEREAAQTV